MSRHGVMQVVHGLCYILAGIGGLFLIFGVGNVEITVARPVIFTVGNVLLSLGAMGLSLFMLAGLRRRKS